MKIYILASILIFSMMSTYTLACEPIALDWDRLYHSNDLNKDTLINREEWKKVSQLNAQPYQWENKKIANDPFRYQIFKQLDKNQDHQLNQDELSGIYLYLPNPCANFNDHDAEQPSTLWQRFLDIF